MDKEKNKPLIGGQALIEGILMRCGSKQAIVCRTEHGIVQKTDIINPLRERYKICNIPVIRGVISFLESMIYGTKALMYSSELTFLEQSENDRNNKSYNDKSKRLIVVSTVLFGILLSVFLFSVLPTFLVGLIKCIETKYILRNLLEGVVKIVILILYILFCRRLKEVRRVFEYHGAEHKTIFCYEHNNELTVENVKKESRFHPRCGTSFLFIIVIVSVFIGSFVCVSNVFARIGVKLILLPIIVGISYEIGRWTGAHDNTFSKIIATPGKLLQRLTTSEPDDSMIECAIASVLLVTNVKGG